MKKVIVFLFGLCAFFASGQNQIIGFEYWFNNEFSERVSQSISPSAEYSLNLAIEAEQLPEGVNTLHVRFFDQNQIYSIAQSSFFVKYPSGLSQENRVVAYQYWFNNDFENAVTESIPAETNPVIMPAIETHHLPGGVHLFHVRFLDERNSWSSVSTQLFVSAPYHSEGTNKLVAFEYWFGNDYPNAITLEIPEGSEPHIFLPLDATHLNLGLNILNIRFMDERGLWSSAITGLFIKKPFSSIEENLIVAYEYWFDSNFDETNLVFLDVPVNPYELFLELDMTRVPKGYYDFNFRSKDTLGLWSVVITENFYKEPLPIAEFSADQTDFCDFGFVQFYNTSFDGDVFFWDFGDGSTSDEFEPLHFFETPGEYLVSLTTTDIPTGRDSTSTLLIRVHPSYEIVENQNICEGGIFEWQGAFYSETGIYFKDLQSSHGCDSILVLQLYVFELPEVSLIGLEDFYCLHSPPVTLSGTPEGGVFAGPGVSGNVFDPGEAGIGTWEISYTYVDENDCENSDTFTVEVDPCTGIEETALLEAKVFPNPTTGELMISLGREHSNVTIRIFDLAGQQQSAKFFYNTSEVVTLINGPPGIYFVLITTNEGRLVKKVIKQ